MQSKRAGPALIPILVPTALSIGYLLGGFVAIVMLVVGGAAWWALTTFSLVGLLAGPACLWLWRHRSPPIE